MDELLSQPSIAEIYTEAFTYTAKFMVNPDPGFSK